MTALILGVLQTPPFTIWTFISLLGYYFMWRFAFSYFSGLRTLATAYRYQEKDESGNIHRWQSCSINSIRNVMSVDIGVSANGLYLKGICSPAVQIPWNHIERLPNKKKYCLIAERFRLGHDSNIRFEIYQGTPISREIQNYKPLLHAAH